MVYRYSRVVQGMGILRLALALAFARTRSEPQLGVAAWGEVVCGVSLGSAIELFVDAGVAQNCLHVIAGLSKWDGFHELGRVAILALSHPFLDAIGPRVVSGQGVFERSSKLVDHAAEVARAQLQIDCRSKQLGRAVALQFYLVGNDFAGFGQQ